MCVRTQTALPTPCMPRAVLPCAVLAVPRSVQWPLLINMLVYGAALYDAYSDYSHLLVKDGEGAPCALAGRSTR
jgi:hypothetical protein